MSKTHILTIHLEDLQFKTIIGILPQERIEKQNIIINLSFKYEYNPLKNNFINYINIIEDIKQIFNEKKFKLLEEALLYLEKFLTEKNSIQSLQLKIVKPDILQDCNVGASILN